MQNALPLKLFATFIFAFLWQSTDVRSQDDDDPFKSTKALPSGIVREAVNGERDFDVRLNHNISFTAGDPGCPCFVLGRDVISVETLNPIIELEGEYHAQGLRALSADGKWFAGSSKSPNQTETTVTVWSTDTGKRVMEVPGDPEKYWDFIAFSRNQYLLVGGRHSNKVDVWEVVTGIKLPKAISVPDRRVESNSKLVFSPDGKTFANVSHDKVVLAATANSKRLHDLDNPAVVTKDPPVGRVRSVHEPTGRPTDSIFAFAMGGGLRYSPDGEEIAIFSSHPTPRLLVWSIKGKLLVDAPLPFSKIVGHDAFLSWAPDGKSILVNGYLVDRATGRVLLSVRAPFASNAPGTLISNDQIACELDGEKSSFKVVKLPWNKLNASLKQVTSKGSAKLTPGKPVSLVIDAQAEDVSKVITELMTERLARDGIPVQPGQSTVFSIKLSESAGETLPIYESQSLLNRRGRDTGLKATEVKGAAVLEWRIDGSNTPLWRGHLKAQSGRSFHEDINNATLRKSMISSIAQQLQVMDIPYFIPDSPELVSLPAVIE